MTKVLEQVHQPPPGTGRLERDRCVRWELRDEPLQTLDPVGESILSDLALFDEIGTAQAAGYGREASRPPRPFSAGTAYTDAVGHVCSIHEYVAVGSAFRQPGGAVMLRIGTVIRRFGS